jgi:hypothetical protein
MRFLKRRRDVHAVPVQPRAHRLAVIRWVYISGVAILAVWLANFAFGGLLYLQSEGLVLGEPGVVAAEFPVTVRDIMVRQGERVKKGQAAAVVSSQNVTETIARLTAKRKPPRKDASNDSRENSCALPAASRAMRNNRCQRSPARAAS